ncbi:MAG TPA: helix-turn-helix domain-containing protein [Acidimicrobiales bacterium]|nr:helix-turn-helix domain-containing protein [Acidimicrobiales bacterium]
MERRPRLREPDSESPSDSSRTDFASAVTAISAAFGDPTRREIYLYAHACPEGVTATETAEHFDLHPNVARHHLDKLATGGYVEVDTTRTPRPGAGRPSKRYRVVGSGSGSAPALTFETPLRRDDVLVTLLGRALAMLPREHAERMAEDVGVEYGRVMASSLEPSANVERSFRDALHAVAEALTAHGFAAHAEKSGGKLRIVSEHCPFGDAVIEHPVICAVDRGMVKGMLESLWGATNPNTQSSLPMGDDKCVTTVIA